MYFYALDLLKFKYVFTSQQIWCSGALKYSIIQTFQMKRTLQQLGARTIQMYKVDQPMRNYLLLTDILFDNQTISLCHMAKKCSYGCIIIDQKMNNMCTRSRQLIYSFYVTHCLWCETCSAICLWLRGHGPQFFIFFSSIFNTYGDLFGAIMCINMHKMAFSVHCYFHYFNLEHYGPLPKLLSSMALGDPKRGHNLGDCP